MGAFLLGMKPIYFITSNAHKLQEAQAFIPELQGLALNLPEIQNSEPRPVIEAKLLAALPLVDGYVRFIVEDTGLYLAALQGLPGPLIKWFIAPEKLGLEGLWRLIHQLGNTQAEAVTVIGYLEKQSEGVILRYFEGRVKGELVAPCGTQGFGWDAIFRPEGAHASFAAMSTAEKAHFSMRRKAFQALREFLASC